MNFLKRTPFHTFLIPIYAVLSLWAANIREAEFYTAVEPLILALILSIFLFMFFLLLFRNLVKAALASSLVELLFFYYGHIFDVFQDLTIGSFIIGRHRYLMLICAIVMIAGLILIARGKGKKRLASVNLYANIFSLMLTIFVLLQIGKYELSVLPDRQKTAQEARNTPVAVAANSTAVEGPDVYYIILDGYYRQDAMLDNIHYDNSDFIEQLEELGFVVPNCTQSNYDNTYFSMTSALNMNYLDQLDIPWKLEATDYQTDDFIDFIHNNQVRQELAKFGYQFVTFKSNYRFINISDSDIYYNREANEPFYENLESVNFYYLFLRTTALRYLLDSDSFDLSQYTFLPDWLVKVIDPDEGQFSTDIYKKYAENVYAIEKLTEIPELTGNQFVYAHLLITHHPFVFNSDGSFRNERGEGLGAYRDSVIYADKVIIKTIKQIIERSDTPPIIILQGDHGYLRDEDRVKILNAYYLPDGGDEVYPSITPVNTFRIVLNKYFGGEYSLLEDKSFITPSTDSPYVITEVNGSCIAK